MSFELTQLERDQFAAYEHTIERGLKTFVEVGQALKVIRDEQLYREDHTTFEEYCKTRWQMSPRRGYQLIDGATVWENLARAAKDAGDETPSLPLNERQTRPLASLDEEEQLEAWNDAVEKSGGKPTSADVDEAVKARTGGSGTGHPAHSTGSDEWYTPDPYIESIRSVLDGIDLDPASCEEAQEFVQAEHYYTKEEDGLAQSWNFRSIFANPPYSMTADFVDKFEGASNSDATESGILLVYANTDVKWFQKLWQFWLCFTDHRIKHRMPGGETGKAGGPKGSVFAYFGPEPEQFARIFDNFGQVVPPLEGFPATRSDLFFSPAAEAEEAAAE